MYDAAFEKDNCGFGLMAQMDGEPSHWLVQTAVKSLARLTHRGAVAADGKTGDGCGLLMKRPTAFLRAVAAEQGIALGELFAAGVVDWNELQNFLGAIQMGHTNDAAAMLENDTNLVRGQFQSKTPLHEAAAAGNLPLVKRLLELGADINEPGDILSSGGMGKTPLHWAVECNHPEVCQFLLQSGANPNVIMDAR